jgi:ATP-dependent DNA helicase PIF1
MKYVLIPKFGITDYWFRYEFQGRGSTHVHGFAWLDPSVAPEVQTAPLNEESRRQFTEFWSKHVFAVNPEPNRVPPARRSRGTYNTNTADLDNTFAALSDVVNRTQKHACTEAYCLRKRKRAATDAPTDLPRQCRFYFPRATGPARTNKVRSFFLE